MFLLSTGVFIPLTPGYVISIDSFPVPRGLAGELFCRVLSSMFFSHWEQSPF